MKLFKHLRDNRGDENVSKLIWVVIVFVVGAILLTTIFSAFKTPISGWYDNLVDSWFGEPAPEQRYSLGDDEVQNSYELTDEGIGATFLINGEPVDCFAAYDVSKTEDDNVYAYLVYNNDDDTYAMYMVGTGEMTDIMVPGFDDQYYQLDIATFKVVTVVIEDGITRIGAGAFQYFYNLTTVSLPESMTSIGEGAFAGCINLALTSLPENLTSISNYAFQNCANLTLTSLPEGITLIGEGAFQNCTSLPNELTIPSTVATIGLYAFENVPNINYDGDATGSPWGALTVNGEQPVERE